MYREAETAEETLVHGGAAWDISKKGVAPKRKCKDSGRRNKRRKLEKLVGWGEGGEEEDAEQSIQNWLKGVEGVDRQEKSERMKQMEISFGKEVSKRFDSSKKDIAAPKISKEEKKRKAAEMSHKLTDWLKPRKRIVEWFEDPDLPELEDVMEIEEREISRMIDKKKLVESEEISKEEEEHDYLDCILEDRGVTTTTTIPGMNKVKEDWEVEAHSQLDDILCVEDRLEVEDDDIMESKMRTYLTNTNLLSKRIVGATSSVEPHPHESELLGDGCDIVVNVKDRHDILSKDIVSETN